MYNFTFTTTEQDYIDYTLHYFKTSPEQKRHLFIGRIVLPLIIAIIAVVNIVAFLPEATAADYFTSAMFLVVAVIFFMLYSPSYRAKQTAKTSILHGRVVMQEYTVRADEDWITESTSDGVASYFYHAIRRVGVSDAAVYLFIRENAAVMIPLRAFAFPEQKEEFLRFISAKIEECRRA